MSRVRAKLGDIYVVSDGMGGHRGGATAAEMTIQVLVKQLLDVDALPALESAIRDAFDAANQAVYAEGHSGKAETEGMGATAVVLLTAGARVMVAHVGDSRAYLYSRRGRLRRLTRDHSRVQRMIDDGMLSPSEAENHPDAGLLERAVGSKQTVQVEIQPWLRLTRGDRIVLCSDGLCGYATDDEIAEILAKDEKPQKTADQLVKLALEKGGEDNVTVQVLKYEGGAEDNTIWNQMLDRVAFLLLAAAVSAVTAFMVSQYVQAPELAKLTALAQKPAESDPNLLNRVAGIERSLAAARAETASLGAKVDALLASRGVPGSDKGADATHAAATKRSGSNGKAKPSAAASGAKSPAATTTGSSGAAPPAKHEAEVATEPGSKTPARADSSTPATPAAPPPKDAGEAAAAPSPPAGNGGATGSAAPKAGASESHKE
jgi:protein phosphatase